MFDTKGRKYVQPTIDKSANFFIKKNISAITVTVIALILGLIAAIFLAFKFYVISVTLLWVSGYLDAVDGTIARKTSTQSKLGGFLDLVFDRLVEIAFLIAICTLNTELSLLVVFVLSAIILSMTVFLASGALIQNTGAKSFHYQTGLAERTEGFIMVTLCALLFEYANYFLVIFALIIAFTAIQRFRQVIKYLKEVDK